MAAHAPCLQVSDTAPKHLRAVRAASSVERRLRQHRRRRRWRVHARRRANRSAHGVRKLSQTVGQSPLTTASGGPAPDQMCGSELLPSMDGSASGAQWSDDTFDLYEMALSKVLSRWKVKLLMKGLRRYGPKLTGALRDKVAPTTAVWLERLVEAPALEGNVGSRIQALAGEVSREQLTDLARALLENDVSLRPTRVARGALSVGVRQVKRRRRSP